MTTYRVDPSQSRVWVEARSNVHPINSSTDGLQGYVEFESPLGGERAANDVGVLTGGRLSLPVTQLTSGNPFEDRELRRRIDAKRYPTIDGELRRAEPGDDEGSWLVSGDLTFRGVTRTFQDLVVVTSADPATVKLTGQSCFDVRDFGMDPPRILMLRVEPDVTVRIDLTAKRET